MAEAIERARQRRAQAEIDAEGERKKGASSLLAQLEQKMAQRVDDKPEVLVGSEEAEPVRDWEDRGEDRVDRPPSRDDMKRRERTESGSSDGSRQGREGRGGPSTFGRQNSRNLPPRFLKQQEQARRQQYPTQVMAGCIFLFIYLRQI